MLSLVRRAIGGLGVVLGVVTLMFFLLRLAPGDPALLLVGPAASAEQVAAQRRSLGLDRTVTEQYATWLGRFARGDWGTSIATGRPVDVAAVNAGIGRGGAFVDTDPADLLDVVHLNVASTVHLTRLLLGDMVARDAGRLLLTSSIASTMPGSFHAVYNASKSFLQSFTEALQNELKDTPVTLTTLMPGPTETESFDRAEMSEDTKVGTSKKDDPAQVARQGFEAMMSGRPRAVGGGLRTKVQEAAAKVMPDRLKAAVHRQMAEPGSGS